MQASPAEVTVGPLLKADPKYRRAVYIEDKVTITARCTEWTYNPRSRFDWFVALVFGLLCHLTIPLAVLLKVCYYCSTAKTATVQRINYNGCI